MEQITSNMQYELKNVRADQTPKGKILIYWLGGYGFTVKFDNGQVVCIDPYLSDCVERIAGFRRLNLAPISAAELRADIYLITHNHPDHLDPDSFDAIVQANPGVRVIAGESCKDAMKDKAAESIKAGESIGIGDVKITAIAADHGDLCPDSIGFLLENGKRSIYFTGDTSRNFSLLAQAIESKPEVIVPCINPAFGNLGEKGAAELAAKCQSKIAVPAHFGLFAEHGGDVELFREELKRISPHTQAVLLTPGRGEAI